MQTRQEITTPLTLNAWHSCYEALKSLLSNKKEILAQEYLERLESIKSGIEETMRKESLTTSIHGYAFTPQIESLQNLYDALIKQTEAVELKGLSTIIQTFLKNNPRVLKKINPNDISNGTFIIPFGVTSIDGYAFYNYTALTSVTIPASVTLIGTFTFDNCPALTTIIIDANNQQSYQNILNMLPDNLQAIAKRIDLGAFKERFVTTMVNESARHGFFGGKGVPGEVTGIILAALSKTYGLPPIDERATGKCVNDNITTSLSPK